jgi:tetratricopeptide (TPR) repeat protein
VGLYCEHGLRPGICSMCWAPRSTATLYDAWVIHRSGFGSWVEWSECAEIFQKSGFPDEADYCSLRAIDSLGRLPGREPIKLREVLSIFIRGRLHDGAVTEKGQVSLRKVANRLSDARDALQKIREQRQENKLSISRMTEVDLALAKTILLARDGRRYSRVQLAAMFRRFDKRRKFRWDKPSVSISLMNEHLSKHQNDVAALVVKAGAQGDLGLWHEAKTTIEQAIKLAPEDTFALVTYGRVLLGLGLGMKAWIPISKAYEIRPNLPTAAMLMMSCAQAKLESNLSSEDLSVIEGRRAFAAQIIRKSADSSDQDSLMNLDRITIEALLFDRRFVEVVVFVREIHEEGRLPNADYWNKEIDMAIIHSNRDVTKIRSEAAKIRDDLFPDVND